MTQDKEYRMKLLDKDNLQGGIAVYRDNFRKYFVISSFSYGFYYEQYMKKWQIKKYKK